MRLVGNRLGKYRILDHIGPNDNYHVYRAYDTELKREVAVKVVYIKNAEIRQLFDREAEIIAKLDHPHILPLFDQGEEICQDEVEGEQEIGYLVMPYRKEGSLEDWLNKQRKKGLSLKDAEHLIGQMAEAIQYMHNKDVLHRDIKPANFLIQSSSAYLNLPHLELADFGISKFNTGSPTKLRVTIAYTAPEQWDGKPPSKLNFIFSWLNFYPLIVK